MTTRAMRWVASMGLVLGLGGVALAAELSVTHGPAPAPQALGGETGPADADGDGLPDNEDACPESDMSDTVVIDECDTEVENTLLDDGCTFSDLIADCAAFAKNHGQFVRCVAELIKDLEKQGLIDRDERNRIRKCAAHADLP